MYLSVHLLNQFVRLRHFEVSHSFDVGDIFSQDLDGLITQRSERINILMDFHEEILGLRVTQDGLNLIILCGHLLLFEFF